MTQQTDLEPFDQLHVVGAIEVDHFCHSCGYNLISGQVRRDPRTKLLLVRCPECGSYHDARQSTTVAHVWLQRLARLGLFAWMGLLVAGAVIAMWIHVVIIAATVDELHWPLRYPDYAVAANEHLLVLWGAGYAGNFLFAGLVIGFVTVAFSHWRRIACLAFGFVWQTVAFSIAVGILYQISKAYSNSGRARSFAPDAPDLMPWAYDYLIPFGAAGLVGMVTGAYLGRPVMRLAVRIMLPKRVRPVLSFLWTADGLERPK